MPADQPGADEYFIEQLIRHHIDSGAHWPIAMIHQHRRDLTADQVYKRICELCDINEAILAADNSRAREAAADEYAVALMHLAQRPDDVMDMADAVQAPKLEVVK